VDRPEPAPSLYALLIGVDRYLQQRLPSAVSYPSLAGAVGDVEQVEELLVGRLGVPPERVRKLTAPHGSGGEPPEPAAARPTYDNLVAGFRWLGQVARPGEQVLVHYSGHGGRATTSLPEVKGEEGLDECLVPHDFARARRYLRDTEIQVLLRELVDARVQVTLVFDCCHAGGALREGPGAKVAVRGVDEIDRGELPRDSLVAPREELAAGWRRRQKERGEAEAGFGGAPFRGMASSRAFTDAPWGYVLLAACRPHESAFETSFDDGLRWGGALSHHLLKSLREGGLGLSYRQLYDRLLARIHTSFPSQTPQLEGEAERLVLGRASLPTAHGVTVLEGEEKRRDWIALNTGQVQGVARGARFALYPPSVAAPGGPGKRAAVAEVVEPGATRSIARIRERRPAAAPVEAGDQALLIDPGPQVLRRPVRRLRRFLCEDEVEGRRLDEEVVQEAASLVRLERALVARRSLYLDLAAGNGRHVEGFVVQVGDDGCYEILDPAGLPLPNLRPAIPVGAPEAAEQVVERLDHLARFRNVQQLENRDPAAPLRGKLRAVLERLPEGYRQGEPLRPCSFAGDYRARVGEWVCLTVANGAAKVLNLAILDLQPSWAIVQVHPPVTRGPFDPIEPGKCTRLPFQATLPPGYQRGTDVIKVFATTEPVSYRNLQLPPLDDPDRTEGPPTPPANDLERLFAALTRQTPATRGGPPPLPEGSEWWIEQLELEVVGEGATVT
jgi:Caspase domain